MAAAQVRYLAADPARKARKKERLKAYNQLPEVIERRNAQQRERYRKDPEVIKARTETYRKRRLAKLQEIKNASGCADCGRRDGNLHFDHRPGTTKLFTIASRSNARWEAILAEIEKCDVRCASCHAFRHAAERRR